MNIKYLVGASAAAVFALSTAGHAADAIATEPVVVASAYDWSGFYFGVHAGYGSGSTSARTTLLRSNGTPYADPANTSFDVDGFLGGVQGGFNMQMDQFVLGIEGEYTALDVKGDINFDTNRPEATSGGNLDSVAALKARAGFAFDRTMIFGTAGYAAGWTKGFANNVWQSAPVADSASGKGTIHGYVVGVGVEHAFTDKISLKAEYNYYGFGRGDFDMISGGSPAGAVIRTEPKTNLNIFKVGLNYHF